MVMTLNEIKRKTLNADQKIKDIIDCNPGITAGEVAQIMRKPISYGFTVLMAIDRLLHDNELYTGEPRHCSSTGYVSHTYYARRDYD